ncbi:MAG: hypothetical protein M1816_002133 [Peltula sp. TS41687]|nr:MAG: hypothetical protein M1816_002133 [Peltula sp. TS41687]
MSFFTAILTLLYLILYPVITLIGWLLILLSPVLYLLRLLLLDTLILLPLRVLAKLETLFIYLTNAALLGVVAGTVLHFTYASVITAVKLDWDPAEEEEGNEARGKSKPSTSTAASLSPLLSLPTVDSRRTKGQFGGKLNITGVGLSSWDENNRLRNDRDREVFERGAGKKNQNKQRPHVGDHRGGRRRGGLLAQTILEEEDDDSEEGF